MPPAPGDSALGGGLDWMISKRSLPSEQFCDFQGIKCFQLSLFRGLNTARPWEVLGTSEAQGNELFFEFFALSCHHLISGMGLFLVSQGSLLRKAWLQRSTWLCQPPPEPSHVASPARRHKHSHLCQAWLTWSHNTVSCKG